MKLQTDDIFIEIHAACCLRSFANKVNRVVKMNILIKLDLKVTKKNKTEIYVDLWG